MKTGINIVFCFLFLFGKVLSMPSFPSTKIKYIVEKKALGTAGSLSLLKSKINLPIIVTNGDIYSNINFSELLDFHRQHGKLATVTAITPPGRYGAILSEGSSVTGFQEKPPGDGALINGGFFVLKPSVLDRITDDRTSFESNVLPQLAADGQLSAFKHKGFWQPMDTLRDRAKLEEMWMSGEAPWKIW